MLAYWGENLVATESDASDLQAMSRNLHMSHRACRRDVYDGDVNDPSQGPDLELCSFSTRGVRPNGSKRTRIKKA